MLHLDFLVAMASHHLDFGFIYSFDGSNPPPLETLESSSSSGSLESFWERNPFEIYQRISTLEAREYYNLPPQNAPGDYERQVRENLSRARSLGSDFYNLIFDREYSEVRILEQKGLLQDRLTDMMLQENNLSRIMELSPYSDVRKEAYHFIQDRFPPVHVNSLDSPLILPRSLLEERVNSLKEMLNDQQNLSEFYQEFYLSFTDAEFRRANGLPLP